MPFSLSHAIDLKFNIERQLAACVIGYQLILLIFFSLGLSTPLFLLTAVVIFPTLFFPQKFWFNSFILSLFIFFKPIGGHLLVEFAAYTFTALFFIRHLLYSQTPMNKGGLFWPIIIFITAIGFSLAEPYDYVIGFKNYIRYFLLFGVYWALHNYLKTVKQIERGLICYLVYTFFASATMILAVLAHGGSRKFGIAGVPINDLQVASVIIALVYFLLAKSKVKSWCCLTCYFLFAIILIQTRGVWLSSILTFSFISIVLIIQRSKIHQRVVWYRVLTLVIGTAFCTILVLIAFPTVLDFIGQKISQLQGSTSLKNNSIFSRLLIWTTAWEMFIQNPINGIGIDLFPHASHLYYDILPILFLTYVQGLDPHLLVLTFLCETGIIGTIGFLTLLLWNLRIGYLNFKLSKSLAERKLALAIWSVLFLVFISSFYAGAWFYGQNGFQFIFFMAMNSALYNIRSGKYPNA